MECQRECNKFWTFSIEISVSVAHCERVSYRIVRRAQPKTTTQIRQMCTSLDQRAARSGHLLVSSCALLVSFTKTTSMKIHVCVERAALFFPATSLARAQSHLPRAFRKAWWCRHPWEGRAYHPGRRGRRACRQSARRGRRRRTWWWVVQYKRVVQKRKNEPEQAKANEKNTSVLRQG